MSLPSLLSLLGKLSEFVRRLQYLVTRRSLHEELDEEIQFHIDMKTDELVASGMSEEKARRTALRQFGNRTLAKQDSRSVWQFGWVEALVQDTRFGLRTLARNPIFTVAVVLTLALGIGANTAIYTLVDSVMLRELPVEDPGELYVIGASLAEGTSTIEPGGNHHTALISYPLYRHLSEYPDPFEEWAAISSFDINAYVSPEAPSIGRSAERVETRLVTGNFFPMLGIEATLGRTLTRSDDVTPGAHPVVVISHRYWARKFAQRQDVVGRRLRMNGLEYTIVGVTPRSFFGVTAGRATDVWVPMMMQAELMREPSRLDDMATMWVRVIGRARSGVSDEQLTLRANAQFRRGLMEEQGSTLTLEREKAIADVRIELVSFAGGFANLRRRFAEPLSILMGVVGMVLLIACANVGNLLLARAGGRRREIALRMALGSRRGRLVRQLLTESLILAFAGGALALLLTRWTLDFLLGFISRGPGLIPIEVPLDGRLMGFTIALCIATALLFGLTPALRATRVDLSVPLRNRGTTGGEGHERWDLRKALVVAQVALSLLLLIGSGLFLRSLQNLRQQETGFRSEGVLLVEIDPRGGGYTVEQLPALYEAITERLQGLPQVGSASLSYFHLFQNSAWRTDVFVAGFDAPEDDGLEEATLVTPGYFETVGAPVIQGRAILPSDSEDAPKVAVVNETFARHFFAGQSAIGRRFRFGVDGTGTEFEIVGVAADIVYHDYRDETPRFAYFPVAQSMDYLQSLTIRTQGDGEAVAPAVRQALSEVAPSLPIVGMKTLDEQIEASFRDDEVVTQLTSLFGLLALALASIGLYGLLAYGVSQRANELGIRLALGATRMQVLWMVLRDGMVLVGLGILIGLPVAVATTRFASTLLFGLGATDLETMVKATLVLCFVALLAGYLPAHKASRLDPTTSLRHE